MIKVEFKIKGGIKEVTVDFYKYDWAFLNHLKRRVSEQITGSVQKNQILLLINKGIFTVKEDDVSLYSKLSADDNNLKTEITYINPSIYTDVINKLNIEEICTRLDDLELETINLHQRLQYLFSLEEKLIVDKMTF
jgi:transcriptional regulator CtsR